MATVDGDSYDDTTGPLDALGKAMCNLINEVLAQAGIKPHSVDYRVKTHASAIRKISDDSEKYAGFESLTDMLGLRVITYFSDDVDRVSAAITPELAIDRKNSIDKRAILDADRFGYLSVHYIATLTAERLKLKEYARFKDAVFEIQIRSILQHAWAEIEHDLGYKVEESLPRQFRRRFSRLAGLLELADDEFVALQADLAEYAGEVASQLKDSGTGLRIDQVTLVELLKTDKSLMELDQTVAKALGGSIINSDTTKRGSQLAVALNNIGLTDLSLLRRLLTERSEHIVKFIQNFTKDLDLSKVEKVEFRRGVSIFYLIYTLVPELSGHNLEQWLLSTPAARAANLKGGSTIPHSAVEFLERVRATWAEVVEELGAPPPMPE